jgi:hypothetical protein
VAGSCEGGNEMLIPKYKRVKFFAVCETVSQEVLGSGEVKLKVTIRSYISASVLQAA